jgi:hypothetical protein
VVIICHKVIPEEEATKYGIKALWFFWNGGYIEQSKLKYSSLIAMFGWRWAQDLYRWNKSFISIGDYYHLWWFFFQ